jgi:hypothetical protein
VRELGERERILATAITQQFTLRADGELRPLVEGSTRLVGLTDAYRHREGETVRLQHAVKAARRFRPGGFSSLIGQASPRSLELRNRRDAYARRRYRCYLISISDPARVGQLFRRAS